MWTMNFQIFNLDLEKAEEPEIKLPHVLAHGKSMRVPGKHLLLLYWLCQSFWVCRSHLWKILQEMGIQDHLSFLLKNLYAGQEAKLRNQYVQAVYWHPAYLPYMQCTSCKMLGCMKQKVESRLSGECQQPHTCRWHHPYGRKWRGTEKPLDECGRG